MFKKIPNFLPQNNLIHRIPFHYIFLFILLFSYIYSFPDLISNTLPTKYFRNIKSNDIEDNVNLYLLSTRDGYLHALNKNKQEIWKAYLEQELMSSSFTARTLTKNLSLFPFNELIYVIENGKIIRFDIYIKDLVERRYVSVNELNLVGKIKSTIFIIDLDNGEILQKIDEDCNFLETNKKVYIRQKNRRKNILTVIRVDYILDCLEIKEGKKYWNATYSDILIKKGNDYWDNNNFFYKDYNFLKKLVNEYKRNNLINHEINPDNVITAYAYFDNENIPNIKIYDRSISLDNLNSLIDNEMQEEIKYLDNYNRYKNKDDIIINEPIKEYENLGEYHTEFNVYSLPYKPEKKDDQSNIIMHYIKVNKILVTIIIILIWIIFYILKKYKYNNNIPIEIRREQQNEEKIKSEININENKDEEKEIINKEEENKNSIKISNIDKEEKENTNITEESKDIILEEIKEEKKECDNEVKRIISKSIKDEDSLSDNIKNEENEEKKKEKNEKTRKRNSIWDSDDDNEDEEEEEKEEQSKTKSKRTIKTKSQKSNKEENENENENQILIGTRNNDNNDDDISGGIIFDSKKENIKLNKKTTRLDTDFENLEKIGEGGYGLVLKGTHKIDKYIYAIKIINISNFKNNKDIDDIINEANKMSMIKDKYIVNYNICWYEDNLGSAEKFYTKKEEEDDGLLSKSSVNIFKKGKIDEVEEEGSEEEQSIKINNSTKIRQQESIMNNFKSLYCTSFRDDSKLINNSMISMKYKKKFFLILMEYCDGNTLEDVIKRHKDDSTPIDRKDIYIYTKQILKGLKVLHRNGIIHSDIKPGNIFLKKNGENEQIKIGDFGMAMLKKGGVRLNSKDIKGFTPLYSAPEQKNRKGTYNEKIDIYACGLILYELIGGFETNAEKYKAFDDLKEDGKIFEDIEKKYKEESELIKLMTKKDYDERPSAEEVLGNNLFKELGKIVNK